MLVPVPDPAALPISAARPLTPAILGEPPDTPERCRVGDPGRGRVAAAPSSRPGDEFPIIGSVRRS
ncbi:hypothetical protein Ae505Ps2_3240 [Pseudonocardia sp. Ae505_Ps2]|nr:hypothetical protein Ae505Ps2_3240 [Pseudonocardia sp. Ae505_Ps2]